MTNLLKELQNEFREDRPESNAKDLLTLLNKDNTVIDVTQQEDGKQVHIQFKEFPVLTGITPLLYRDFGLVLLGTNEHDNRVWFCTKDFMNIKKVYG